MAEFSFKRTESPLDGATVFSINGKRTTRDAYQNAFDRCLREGRVDCFLTKRSPRGSYIHTCEGRAP